MHDQGIVFVKPEGSEGVSGGNLYNRQLIGALGEWPGFRCVEVNQFCEQEQSASTYIVDSLNLRELSQVVSARVPGQRYILLLHYLPSMNPDLAESSPDVVLERSLMKEFDGFVVTSSFSAEYLKQAGHGERVFVGPPVLPENLSPVRDYTGPPRALMASNLIPGKGVFEFLSALADSLSEETSYLLEIAGRSDMDRDYSASCYDLVKGHERLADKVSFLGTLPHKEMRARYEEANLYISSSRMETYGIALQEARHFGLPIVAVDAGNSKAHVCPGETGALFATPRQLGQEVAALLFQEPQLKYYFDRAQRGRPPATESWAQLAKRLVETLSVWARGQ